MARGKKETAGKAAPANQEVKAANKVSNYIANLKKALPSLGEGRVELKPVGAPRVSLQENHSGVTTTGKRWFLIWQEFSGGDGPFSFGIDGGMFRKMKTMIVYDSIRTVQEIQEKLNENYENGINVAYIESPMPILLSQKKLANLTDDELVKELEKVAESQIVKWQGLPAVRQWEIDGKKFQGPIYRVPIFSKNGDIIIPQSNPYIPAEMQDIWEKSLILKNEEVD